MRTYLPRPITAKGLRIGLAVAVAIAALLLAVALVSHGLASGSSEIAFTRDGRLLTVRGDGSATRQIAAASVAGFAWSPDHHSIAFRVTSGRGGQTSALTPDAPGAIEAASINGGFPLQISPDSPGFLLSDAWWDAQGNRVLYRETSASAADSPFYVVSQTDQPAGIARKIVTNAVGMPALSADGQRVAAVDAIGDVLVGPPGGAGSVVGRGALTTLATGRPARLLWRPGHDEVLYDAVGADGAGGAVNVMLAGSHGGMRRLAAVSDLVDDAFSPDGSWLLARSTRGFALYRVDGPGTPQFTWPDADPSALPWWSPDSRTLLIRAADGWRRVDVAAKSISTLLQLSLQAAPASQGTRYWSPATDNPWSPDGRSITFVAGTGARWLGGVLPPPSGASTGLYVADVGTRTASTPRLIASGGADRVGWGFADPSTVFLVGAGT